MTYQEFLETKVETAPVSGFDIDPGELNPALKSHQRDAVRWALHGGRRALFESFGLGKTVQEIEFCHQCIRREGGNALIVLPLGVRQEFVHDAELLLHYDAPRYITTQEQITGEGQLYMTNYERVRDGDIDPSVFSCCVLDEAAVLRSYGSKTYQTFLPKFKGVKYKLVATATPAPNKLKELIHYSGFLEIADTGHCLTRFFQRDSTKSNNLTLYPQHEEEFWLWVSTWALFISKPSDLGYDDTGYDLPPMEVRTHVVSETYGENTDKDGQYKFLNDAATSLQEASKEKRQTIEIRAQEVKRILLEHCREYGEKQRRNSGISKAVQGGTQRGTEPQTAGTRENLLPGTQRTNKGEKSQVGRGKPEENEGTPKEPCGEKSGKGQSEIQGVVQKSQGKSEENGQGSETSEGIWYISSNSGCDDRGSEVALRNLWSRDNREDGEEFSAHRSQSQNRGSEGDSLWELQHGIGAVPGFPSAIDESCRLFGGQVILWADLNDEQRRMELICRELGLSFVSIFGADKDEDKLRKIEQWKNREATVFISKREMYGCGVNFQQAHKMIFCGIDYQFHSFIQAIHRVYRFLQTEKVIIDILYTEAEEPIYRALLEKWKLHDEQQERMREIVRKYGLSGKSQIERLKREMGVKRTEIRGTNFIAVNNDCIEEAARMKDDSVDMILTSIPFSNHYEYTELYNDLGCNESTEKFFEQMDFLSPNLLRILKPGRVFCCHVKDRVLFGNATGTGMPTMEPFHAMCIQHYMKHGFQYFGMITVVTDVVRENNQTYRLGYSEQCKDGTKMGVGCPEYILLFRKLPTDISNAYADVPVTKRKEDYSLVRWQLDAHAFWRDGGNRGLLPEELAQCMDQGIIQKRFKAFCDKHIYDYAEHVKLGEEMAKIRSSSISKEFMSLPPSSAGNPDVWDDINRMRTLNAEQKRKRLQMHVCLAEGSLILTRRGYVPIEDIEIGDMVLTHNGNWKPVIAKACTGERLTVQTRAQGVANLITTPDHKLWVKETMCKYRAKRGLKPAKPEWKAASLLNQYCYVNLKLPETETTGLTKEQWWIVGRYLADGHVGTRGDYFVSVGKKKQKEFELHAGEYAGSFADRGTCFQYRLKNLPDNLKEMLARCGKGAENKQVPIEGICLDSEYAEFLLKGYLSGDGNITGNCLSATSVSRALLLGMAMLVQRVYGKAASVYAGKPAGKQMIEGREVNCKQEWVMSCRFGKREFSPVLPDGAWKKVRKVVPAGINTVWSIQVADDASYTAEGCIVKNCPLQFDIVERCITRYTNPGDTVYDPFGGIGTVPLYALKLGRKGIMTELNESYFHNAVTYLESEEAKIEQPTLFDLLDAM